MAVPFLRAPSHGSISAHAGASLEALQHAELEARRRLVMLELREFELQDKFASLSKRAKSRAERFHTAILGDVVLEDLILTDLLGRGGGGTLVHACIVKGWNCAVKWLPLAMSTQHEIDCFEKEIAIMRSLPPHPNVLPCLGYLRAPDRLCLFVTRHTYSLRKHLLKLADNGQRLTRGQVGYIGQQVVGGLKFLHHQGVLHRDLKTDNILVSTNSDNEIVAVVIGDFDSAKQIRVDQPLSYTPRGYAVGTTGWQSPEIESGNEALGFRSAVDVYAFGMVLYELMAMRYPHSELGAPTAIRKAVLAGVAPRLSADEEEFYGPTLVGLFHQCIAFDHSQRPGLRWIETELVSAMLVLTSERRRTSSTSYTSHTASSSPSSSSSYSMHPMSAPVSPRSPLSSDCDTESESTIAEPEPARVLSRARRRELRQAAKRIKKMRSNPNERRRSISNDSVLPLSSRSIGLPLDTLSEENVMTELEPTSPTALGGSGSSTGGSGGGGGTGGSGRIMPTLANLMKIRSVRSSIDVRYVPAGPPMVMPPETEEPDVRTPSPAPSSPSSSRITFSDGPRSRSTSPSSSRISFSDGPRSRSTSPSSSRISLRSPSGSHLSANSSPNGSRISGLSGCPSPPTTRLAAMLSNLLTSTAATTTDPTTTDTSINSLTEGSSPLSLAEAPITTSVVSTSTSTTTTTSPPTITSSSSSPPFVANTNQASPPPVRLHHAGSRSSFRPSDEPTRSVSPLRSHQLSHSTPSPLATLPPPVAAAAAPSASTTQTPPRQSLAHRSESAPPAPSGSTGTMGFLAFLDEGDICELNRRNFSAKRSPNDKQQEHRSEKKKSSLFFRR